MMMIMKWIFFTIFKCLFRICWVSNLYTQFVHEKLKTCLTSYANFFFGEFTHFIEALSMIENMPKYCSVKIFTGYKISITYDCNSFSRHLSIHRSQHVSPNLSIESGQKVINNKIEEKKNKRWQQHIDSNELNEFS